MQWPRLFVLEAAQQYMSKGIFPFSGSWADQPEGLWLDMKLAMRMISYELSQIAEERKPYEGNDSAVKTETSWKD